jgi:chemotaxis-related protein WspB
MLLVEWEVAGQRYVLKASDIREVLPWIPLQPIPLAPPFHAGVCHYRGRFVPVIDAASLVGSTIQDRLSTRIVIVQRDETCLIGLLVDRVLGVVTISPTDQPSRSMMETPLMGQVVPIENRLVHWLSVDDLIRVAIPPDDQGSRDS